MELIIKSEKEIEECKKAQAQHIKEKGYPDFPPSNGVCWCCNRNIYQGYKMGERISNGYSLERASNELITGCPHCHRSYCD